ncbi:uncharacterized protein FOMMEDRAFT_161577 [Fomitiporia mediterranea MF3/22]|uniref:uncharacterized protein n=1 Tax=Fomitiporia mediterranea (strain MF3/22) TaxID=694068 RepID=UPI0004408C56|nr:uncharacterized protein FOMMEDRAFT_161577 [Fomitiporia mediterranea MF3/22]EJC98744.1 hypothetical protein FOMMEDRAFT_161577 [Fomitiporia mediterranea MF3/22]
MVRVVGRKGAWIASLGSCWERTFLVTVLNNANKTSCLVNDGGRAASCIVDGNEKDMRNRSVTAYFSVLSTDHFPIQQPSDLSTTLLHAAQQISVIAHSFMSAFGLAESSTDSGQIQFFTVLRFHVQADVNNHPLQVH